MRIIHKCPAGQGSGSPSPKGKARALAPSQSYRFVNNPHGQLSAYGRRPQIFPEKFPILFKNRKAKTPRASDGRPEEAASEINAFFEPAWAEFIREQLIPRSILA
jgi:hypothetical protein